VILGAQHIGAVKAVAPTASVVPMWVRMVSRIGKICEIHHRAASPTGPVVIVSDTEKSLRHGRLAILKA
jgi:hypothetical protein